MPNKLKLFITILIVVIFTILNNSPALAQTIEQCLIPFETIDYGSFSSYGADIISQNDWVCGDSTPPKECSQLGADNGTYLNGTDISLSGLFPGPTHPPLQIVLQASGLSGGATLNIFIGEAQIGIIRADPSGVPGGFPYTTTVAQGYNYADTVRIKSAGDSNIYNIQISEIPLSSITKTNDLFLDPNGHGIDYPTWLAFPETVTNTNDIEDYGPRSINEPLLVPKQTVGATDNYLCTPIIIDSRLGHTDVTTITLDKITPNSSLRSKFTIIDQTELLNVAAVLHTPQQNIDNVATYTITVPIEITPSITYYERDAYLCMLTLFSSDPIKINNFNSIACAITPDIPCNSINDNEFSLDYELLYQNAPLFNAPIPPLHWVYPTLSTNTLIYNQPPVVVGLGDQSRLQLDNIDNETVGHAISTTTDVSFYQLVFSATATALLRDNLPLEVGIVNSYNDIALLNTFPNTATQNIILSKQTIIISESVSLIEYSTLITNNVQITTPILFLRIPNYSPDDNIDNIQIDNVCVYPVGSASNCPQLPGSDFLTGNWVLTPTATISNGILFMTSISGTIAAATLTTSPTLVFTEPHQLVINVITGTGQLTITGLTTDPLTMNISSGLNTLTLGVIQPFTTFILSAITGSFSINYICIETTGANVGDCLLITNPNFDTGLDWDFRSGGQWEDVNKNAWLPVTPQGTITNQGVSLVGRITSGIGPMPNLGLNQYLIMQFTGYTLGNQTGVLTFITEDFTPTITGLTQTVIISSINTIFEIDMSIFEDHDLVQIAWVNDCYRNDCNQGGFLDNVCLYVSNEPPSNPEPYTDDGVSLGIRCSTVSWWLSDTIGINFPELEILASQPLTIGTVFEGEWVPWLAGKLWLNAGKPIVCTLLALYESGLSNVNNYLDWSVIIPDMILSWYFDLVSYFWDWVKWFSLSVIGFIAWFNGFWVYLWDITWDAIQWVIGGLKSTWSATLSLLILAWNIFLISLGDGFSFVSNQFIKIWNTIEPFFSSTWTLFESIYNLFSNFIFNGGGSFLALFVEIIKLIFDFIQDIIGLPLSFYTTWNEGINGDPLGFLPQCTGSLTDIWCLFYLGFELINMGSANTYIYPFVIVGIMAGTIFIIGNHVKVLFFR